MEIWNLMDDTRWSIIQEVSGAEKTMAEIAEATGTSVANVSQHLKLLEAYGYVKKKKQNDGTPGKPTNIYSLGKSFSCIAFAAESVAKRKRMEKMDQYHKMVLSILLLDKPDDHYFLHKLLWQNEELIEKCDAINFLGSDNEKIELFVLTDDLEDIRKNFSNITLESPAGKEKKIVTWSHNEEELEEGIDRGDDYYLNLVSEFHVIHDPNDKMRRWINGE